MIVNIVSCIMLIQEKNFRNDNSYYVEDFNIKIADSHSHIEIGDEHFIPGVIPIHFMILSING